MTTPATPRRPRAARGPSVRPLLACALLGVLAALGACASSDPSAAATTEESVRPGFNGNFLDPALDVDAFVERFEGESREIAVHHADIVAALGVRPGMDVADVGAGTGLFLRPLHDAIAPDGHLYEVDISPRFVEHLEQRIADEQLPRASVVLCGERSADLPDASVDLVFVCDTYHHFEYPRSTLASLHAALRPGGLLCIVDFERIEGVSRAWTLEHVRCGSEQVVAEVTAAGFELVDRPVVEGLQENYLLRFRRR